MCRISLLFLVLLSCAVPVRSQEFPEESDDEADRCHVRADYLYWWLRRLHTPPLLTTGPQGSSGILGEPGTAILRGGERITSRHDRYIGVRAGVDWWFGVDRAVGLEADAFFLERDSTHFTVRPGDVSVLALPFVSGQGQNNSFVVSGRNRQFGDLLGGSRVYSRMELFGQEGNVLFNRGRSCQAEWNLFAGVRFLQLRERLDLTSSATVLPAQSTLIGLEDHVQSFNKFYGGQVGASGSLKRGRWSLEGRAAVALGADQQLIRNKGELIVHTPQGRQSEPHGLFVQASNRGNFDRVSFDVVSEARVQIGLAMTQHINLHAGYSLLAWDGPVRPGEQIVPRPPSPQFREEWFWAHGANVGMEVRW